MAYKLWGKYGTEDETTLSFTICNIIDNTEEEEIIDILSQVESVSEIEENILVKCIKNNRKYKKDESLWVGLGASHLTNMRHDCTGDYTVTYNNDKKFSPVHIINAFGNMFGPNHDLKDKDKNEAVMSKKLADQLNLGLNDEFTLTRKINNSGTIQKIAKSKQYPHNCWVNSDIPKGGLSWRYKGIVSAIVVFIDEDEDDTIGLSAMFLDNIYKEEQFHKYGPINVKSLSNIVKCKPWNAGGMNSVEGYGIRMSSPLAAKLNVSVGDVVVIYE